MEAMIMEPITEALKNKQTEEHADSSDEFVEFIITSILAGLRKGLII